MLFADRLTLGQPRKTHDGYLAVRARAARSGIYEYLGREVDPSATTFAADQIVRVYRPEEEVFNADSVASFLMKPVTNDHPTQPVTAENWRDHAKGVVGKALRDGEFLAFDIVIMDKGTIKAVEDGKRELSNGYASEINFESGQAANGQRYDAVQRNIRGNHVAIVDKGRAGAHCRISDSAECAVIPGGKILSDHGTYTADFGDGKTAPSTGRRETPGPGGGGAPTRDGDLKMHTLLIDGLQVTEVSDQAKAAIEKLQGQVKTADARAEKAETDVATLTTDKATLEAKVVTLEKQVTDAKLTPQQLRDAAKSYGVVVGKAKALGVTVTDEMDEPAIMKAVVSAKLGDAAKDWNDVQVAASFASLTVDTKVESHDALRETIARTPITANDSGASVRDLARQNQF